MINDAMPYFIITFTVLTTLTRHVYHIYGEDQDSPQKLWFYSIGISNTLIMQKSNLWRIMIFKEKCGSWYSLFFWYDTMQQEIENTTDWSREGLVRQSAQDFGSSSPWYYYNSTEHSRGGGHVQERRSYRMYRTLPTSMESSTATNSLFLAKLLLVTQVQWISVSQSMTLLCRLKWLQWRLS